MNWILFEYRILREYLMKEWNRFKIEFFNSLLIYIRSVNVI